MVEGTRDRMVDAAVALLQHRGVAATSFTDVLAASGAARGAIYHHFPGGKQQLALEAVERNGADVRNHFSQLPSGDVAQVVGAFLCAIRPVVEDSALGSGCAVAAATVDGGVGIHDQAALLRAASGAFDGWGSEIELKLASAGASSSAAQELSTLLITTLEGAHILCRAAGCIEPFDRAARGLMNMVSAATW